MLAQCCNLFVSTLGGSRRLATPRNGPIDTIDSSSGGRATIRSLKWDGRALLRNSLWPLTISADTYARAAPACALLCACAKSTYRSSRGAALVAGAAVLRTDSLDDRLTH